MFEHTYLFFGSINLMNIIMFGLRQKLSSNKQNDQSRFRQRRQKVFEEQS